MELPKTFNDAIERMSAIHEALALLNSMVASGENHSEKSQRVISTGFDAIQETAWFLEKAEYTSRISSSKPRCLARMMKKRGEIVQCNRRAEWNSSYCYSHREWKEQPK